LLQFKAQQAFQEWKQKKLEAERKQKWEEKKKMQQWREAENEVMITHINSFIYRVFIENSCITGKTES